MKKKRNEGHTIEFKSSNSDFFDMLDVSLEPEDCEEDSDDIRQAVTFLREKNGSQTLAALANVVGEDRDARWYYLNALAYHMDENLSQAILYMQQAVQKASDNRRFFLIQQRFLYEDEKRRRAQNARNPISEDDESMKKGKMAILGAAIAFALFYVICLMTGIMK